VGETFVTLGQTAPVLRVVIDNYLKRSGAIELVLGYKKSNESPILKLKDSDGRSYHWLRRRDRGKLYRGSGRISKHLSQLNLPLSDPSA